MTKYFLKTTTISALVLLAAGTVSGCSSEKEGKPAAAAQDEAFPVEVIKVQEASLQRTVNAVGTIRYRRETPLGFTSPGRVASVRFNEGDYVKRGAVLAA